MNVVVQLDGKRMELITISINISDIKDMPRFNSKVRNGISSVSSGKVLYGDKFSIGGFKTVYCKHHGACLCVANYDGRKIYRCSICNEGAYVWEK